METSPHRSADRRAGRLIVSGLIFAASTLSILRADIPWAEVTRKLAEENAKLAHRPGGHAGEYFVVCTLYFTPKESGFTAERGFDATVVSKPGLHGRKYARDFLRAVKKEGFGRLTNAVNGKNYIRYNGGESYSFANAASGGGGTLVRRFSAAARRGGGLPRGAIIETASENVRDVFGTTRWKIVDSGGGLRRWQIDCYYGEDEPLGPGTLMGRPRATTFEYAYANARVARE